MATVNTYTSTLNQPLTTRSLDLRDAARRWWAWYLATDPEQELKTMIQAGNGWSSWWFGDCTGRMVDAAILYR